MSHSHPKKHIPYCLNCHYPLAEFDSFCPNCGQKPTDGKVTMHDLLHEFTHTLFHVDGKLVTTLRHIFVPGKLTLEFFKGHHKRYAHPIQLFLVLGAGFLFFLSLLSHKLEEKVKHKIETANQQNDKKRLLAELDSTARQMPVYKNDPSVRKAVDTLLLNTLAGIDAEKENAVTLQGKAFLNIKAIATKRLLITELTTKGDSLQKLYPIAYKIKMKILATELKNLREDSVAILENFAKSEHTTKDSAKNQLNGYGFGRVASKNVKILVNGKKNFSETDSLQALLNRAIEAEAQEEIPELLDKEISGLSSENDDYAGSFLDGINAGMKKAEEKEDIKKATKENPYQAINKDSVGNLGVTIAKSDMQNLEIDAIFKKYHVKGFWKQRFLGAIIMSSRAGQDKLHAITSKSLWIIVLSLLPNAALLWLLYRRQKRFFVEHLVWLLHVYCFVFLVFPLVFADGSFKFLGSVLFPILIWVMPFLALKNYYKQGWRKTFVKYAIFSMGYFFISLFTFSAGAFLSFLFF
jgi:Protein of unknown function (DUF3667)